MVSMGPAEIICYAIATVSAAASAVAVAWIRHLTDSKALESANRPDVPCVVEAIYRKRNIGPLRRGHRRRDDRGEIDGADEPPDEDT